MARNYGNYGNDDDNSGNNSGSSDNGAEDKNLTLTPFAEIEGKLVKVFGNDNRFGQSLGISWEDVKLVDGCLYHDPDKDNYKVFSWKSVIGMMPGEGDFSSDDANDFLMKTYGTTEKRYELVTAVHPDEDEPESIGNALMWYSGSQKYGPKSASKTLSKILTQMGRDMMVEEDDWYDSLSAAEQARADLPDDDDDFLSWITGWLADTSGDNCLRSDLQGRRFNFFEVKKPSNNSDRHYHHPIVEDSETEIQVTVDNTAGGSETQGTLAGDEGGEKAKATDGGAAAAVPEAQSEEGIPEPVNDFVSSVAQFSDFTRERAETLLEDFITDDGLPLTQDLVDDFGGKDEVLAEAGY